MDADIFGPNIPRMVGVELLPDKTSTSIPLAEAHGIKVISVGFMVDPAQAVICRGPMMDKVLRQFLYQAEWGDLDALIVDLPPGTGDIAISLSKHAQPDGAIVVTTPQHVSADDARKAISMFRRLDVPVLGVVENMSYFEAPDTGHRYQLFGEGGGQSLAEEMDVPLLAQIPFEPVVRSGGDSGMPVTVDAGSQARQHFLNLAEQVREACTARENKVLD
jgi:ATP-binding protein involved in chromosome partitioning